MHATITVSKTIVIFSSFIGSLAINTLRNAAVIGHWALGQLVVQNNSWIVQMPPTSRIYPQCLNKKVEGNGSGDPQASVFIVVDSISTFCHNSFGKPFVDYNFSAIRV